MMFLRRFLGNHVLANLAFGLVLVLGAMAYLDMPRARDPEINFNWINITTVLPGAASIDVEKRITDPLEDAISRTVKDLRFVSSTSRDSVSTILVRFNQLDKDDFRERVADLRREVQNAYNDQLPEEADDPDIWEITSSSGFPTAMIALTSTSGDEDFRRYGVTLKKDLERLSGVDEALLQGAEDPELHIVFHPEKLEGLGIAPTDLVTTIRAYFRDVAIGDIENNQGRWLVRLLGTSGTIEDVESFPIPAANGLVELGELADIYRASAEPSVLVRYQGRPAILFSVTKQSGTNTLDLLNRIKGFVADQNGRVTTKGYQLTLIDDQTVSTQEALSLMQTNSLIGLLLVLVVTFLFLGGRIAFLTSIGIPFTLAGTFILLHYMNFSVNSSVLLGVVIALGMLVDDAVVVVETIYYRLLRGDDPMDAAVGALREVAAPVLTSVLTTISVFLPLMLLPGILGEFMRIIPLVVCAALLISLLEAFWILPAHVAAMRQMPAKESPLQRRRRITTRRIRHFYSLCLIWVLRRPYRSLGAVGLVALMAIGLMAIGAVKFNFFASDPFRLVYVNAELPPGSTMQQALQAAQQLEKKTLAALEPEEVRASVIYSGLMYTATEPLFGDHLGQVFVSLAPQASGMRDTRHVIAAVEKAVGTSLGDAKVSVFMLEDGPPLGQPISVKVRGKEFDRIQLAVEDLQSFMESTGLFSNINIDFKTGTPELKLALNGDAIKRADISPLVVADSLQTYVDGSIVTSFQSLGEEVDVRLLASGRDTGIEHLMAQTLTGANGQSIQLGQLVTQTTSLGYQNIRHYNFQRSITLAADIDTDKTDTIAANKLLQKAWVEIQDRHPGINLDFSGEMDDILEALDGITLLFVMGLGLIYLILGTQFKSYSQPVMVLVAVPLAFLGVVFGLAVTGNPVSLITLYGVVALAGIAVNSAIVLIDAANSRMRAGMGPLHATIFSARRRVIPILITSSTTIAGLFSLAAGVGGKSLLWGPIATAIVSGLFFSTILVLVVLPLLYYASVTVTPADFWRKVLFWRKGKA